MTGGDSPSRPVWQDRISAGMGVVTGTVCYYQLLNRPKNLSGGQAESGIESNCSCPIPSCLDNTKVEEKEIKGERERDNHMNRMQPPFPTARFPRFYHGCPTCMHVRIDPNPKSRIQTPHSWQRAYCFSKPERYYRAALERWCCVHPWDFS